MRRLPKGSVVEGLVTWVGADNDDASGPQLPNLLEQQVIRNPVTGGFRLVFQLKPPRGEAVELRAFLRHGDDVLSETWSYLLRP